MIELHEAPRTSAFSPYWGIRIDDENFVSAKDGIFVKGTRGAAEVTIYDKDASQKAVRQRLSDIDPSIITLQLCPRYSVLDHEAMYQGVSVTRQAERLTGFQGFPLDAFLGRWPITFRAFGADL